MSGVLKSNSELRSSLEELYEMLNAFSRAVAREMINGFESGELESATKHHHMNQFCTYFSL